VQKVGIIFCSVDFFVVLCDNLNRLFAILQFYFIRLIIMYLPDWIQQYKEPRTEIKRINNGFYKYEVAFVYSKEKKRTEKKTIRLLGKITEKDGFIPSSKDSLRRKSEELPQAVILFQVSQHPMILIGGQLGDPCANLPLPLDAILRQFTQKHMGVGAKIVKVFFDGEAVRLNAISEKFFPNVIDHRAGRLYDLVHF
jgi:hypothetical protein